MLGRFALIAVCIATAMMTESAQAQTGDPALLPGAIQALSAKIDSAMRNGTMAPRLNDPDNLVRNAFDRGAIRALSGDMPGMLKVCQSVYGAYGRYMSYITKRADGRPLDSGEQRKRQTSLQDETTLAMATADLCAKGMLAAATAIAANLSPAERRDPNRIAGARQMRNGLAQLVLGTIEAQGVSDLRPGNRALLRESTMEMADVGADAMTPVQRADVRAKIDAAIKSSPASSTAMLGRLRAIYSRVGCSGLCALR